MKRILFVYSEHDIKSNNATAIGQPYQTTSNLQALLDSSYILSKKRVSLTATRQRFDTYSV